MKLALPEYIKTPTAIKTNEEAQKYDGIKKIDKDGTVHFMPYTIKIMKDVLGFECESFKPDECAKLAKEQISLFEKLKRKHNVIKKAVEN